MSQPVSEFYCRRFPKVMTQFSSFYVIAFFFSQIFDDTTLFQWVCCKNNLHRILVNQPAAQTGHWEVMLYMTRLWFSLSVLKWKENKVCPVVPFVSARGGSNWRLYLTVIRVFEEWGAMLVTDILFSLIKMLWMEFNGKITQLKLSIFW